MCGRPLSDWSAAAVMCFVLTVQRLQILSPFILIVAQIRKSQSGQIWLIRQMGNTAMLCLIKISLIFWGQWDQHVVKVQMPRTR